MSNRRTMAQLLLVAAALAVGVGALMLFRATKPEAERAEREAAALLVEVVKVERKRHEVTLRAQGTVIPARRVVIQPEVGGRVRWQNSDLVPGGHISEGQPLLRIDPREYELAVRARKADVSRAQLELRMEEGQGEVARREWEKFGGGKDGESDQDILALREPQRRTAEVAVQSAESALEQARLNLERTTIRAPFNAMVMEENVETGQLVGPQTNAAVLVGTDQFWVQVSVPVEALAFVRVPRQGGEDGSSARVWQQMSGEQIERRGEVVRILPDLDPGGSMARLLLAIDDPLGKQLEGDPGLPVLLNSFVQVEIEAPAIDDVIEVPRAALREGNQVYVMDDDDRLRIRPVSIVWRRADAVLVREGLSDGERLITSRVPAPVEGMALRAAEPTAQQAPPMAEADDGGKGAKPRTREKL